MKNDDDVVAGGPIWHVAYQPFKYPDISSDIQCFHRSDNGWRQQGCLDPAINDQIIRMCKVALNKDH